MSPHPFEEAFLEVPHNRCFHIIGLDWQERPGSIFVIEYIAAPNKIRLVSRRNISWYSVCKERGEDQISGRRRCGQ